MQELSETKHHKITRHYKGKKESLINKIVSIIAYKEEEEKLRSLGGDRRELSVCSIHPQSDAHRTKVWKYKSTPPFRE